MGQGDFTFRNMTGEKIIVKHEFKNVTGETFPLEHLDSKKIQVNIDLQTYEKYWLHDSADKTTGKYVSSDEYKSSEQVTVVKKGGEFQLEFDRRSKGYLKSLTKTFKSSLTWPKTRESGTLPITRPSTSGGDQLT